MSLDDLLERQRARDGYKIVAIVQIGNHRFEKDFGWLRWANRGYRQFFPCDIDGGTDLPLSEYEEWAATTSGEK